MSTITLRAETPAPRIETGDLVEIFNATMKAGLSVKEVRLVNYGAALLIEVNEDSTGNYQERLETAGEEVMMIITTV